ncbi:hypothetical protein GH714_037188 [Hevea brasiliensis]|uniref:MBD domain-containing protein n=1 Tax=Hevea brasiliensis TaxID=3981 RepID=A0A6A6MPK2_HEVBR|nr:hypothetical protein GH714_037188 [Hevea brasiliensis]
MLKMEGNCNSRRIRGNQKQNLGESLVCDRKPGVTCKDAADIDCNATRTWVIDRPGIPKTPKGFKRSLVLRRDFSKMDAYYITPTGKKLRTKNEIAAFLEANPKYKDVSIEDFNFTSPKVMEDTILKMERSRLSSRRQTSSGQHELTDLILALQLLHFKGTIDTHETRYRHSFCNTQLLSTKKLKISAKANEVDTQTTVEESEQELKLEEPNNETSKASAPALDKDLKKAVQKTAATFAPRASTATKNPAAPGTALYTVFEVQGYVSMLLGFVCKLGIKFCLQFLLYARDCSKNEKEALNYLFLLIPLLNVIIPFFWKSFAVVWSADTLAFFGMYAWKGNQAFMEENDINTEKRETSWINVIVPISIASHLLTKPECPPKAACTLNVHSTKDQL